MKKFLGILVLVLLWSSFGNAGEYCFSLNESKKILDTRAESFTDLIFLYKELECLGKSKEAIIYKKEYNKAMKEWAREIVPMNPKGSKNRYKICGQIHLNNDTNNLADPEIAKKYRNCEQKRIEKAGQDFVTYLYQLYYKLENQ